MNATPALYRVWITHTRMRRIHRRFRHRGYLWLVDLDALPHLPWWLRPFARFQARDHPHHGGLGSIRENLDTWLAEHGVRLTGGRVLMLTQARSLGFVFNPLTVYWCYHSDGRPACVVAEVHNTYGERHSYLLPADQRSGATVDKQFYVSPFLPLDGYYRISAPPPGERPDLSVSLYQEGSLALAASVRGTRRTATAVELARLVLRYPLTGHRTWALIHRHGIELWLRRLPIIPRPPSRPPRQPTPEEV